MQICRDDLIALVTQTWQILFAEDVSEDAPRETTCSGLRARVAVTGAWNGAASVVLSEGDAEQIACRLLESKPGELTSEEIRDAVGEMANILTGNLKALVAQPSSLGLPVVSCLTEVHENPEATQEQCLCLTFSWRESHFWVIVEQSSDASAG